MQKTILAVGGTVLFLMLVVGGLWMSAHNREVGLRAQFDAQQQSNESGFDKMWKIIQQQAQVAEVERDNFRETYVAIMEATQGVAGNGQLASFFTQAKVDVSPALFSQLMTSIEAQRESFHRDQQRLLQIQAEHNMVRTKAPSSWFVGGRPALEATIVTSSHTEAVFATGTDDNVDLDLGTN